MATRKNLIDCLARLIIEGTKGKSTELALGRAVVVPLRGELARVRPALTKEELEGLLIELPDGTAVNGQTFRVSWRGSRDSGDLAIIVEPNHAA
jgi:hypothetical protein